MMKRLLVMFFLLQALSACTTATPAPNLPPAVDGIVRVVMFYTPGCGNCEAARTDLIPKLLQKYGSRLRLTEVPLNGIDDVNTLIEGAKSYGIAKENVHVPFVVIGGEVLVGLDAVQNRLSGLIDAGLAQNGVKSPDLPPLLAALVENAKPTPGPAGPSQP